MSKDDMQETVRKYNMKTLAVGNDLTSPHEFNLTQVLDQTVT